MVAVCTSSCCEKSHVRRVRDCQWQTYRCDFRKNFNGVVRIAVYFPLGSILQTGLKVKRFQILKEEG